MINGKSAKIASPKFKINLLASKFAYLPKWPPFGCIDGDHHQNYMSPGAKRKGNVLSFCEPSILAKQHKIELK
jgi:hypothetical protein